jgi:hypothetical protein
MVSADQVAQLAVHLHLEGGDLETLVGALMPESADGFPTLDGLMGGWEQDGVIGVELGERIRVAPVRGGDVAGYRCLDPLAVARSGQRLHCGACRQTAEETQQEGKSKPNCHFGVNLARFPLLCFMLACLAGRNFTIFLDICGTQIT